MIRARLAGVLGTALAAALGGACAADDATNVEPGLAASMHAYSTDPTARRRALEDSLVVRDNAYASLRLASYDDEHWGALPIYAPRTAPLGVAPDGTAAPPPDTGDAAWTSLAWEDVAWTEEDLRRLGERAFFAYPVQIVPTLRRALDSDDHAGVWSHDGRFGAVWVAPTREGAAPATAFTCATCHASVERGALVPGKNAADLDAGRLAGDGARGPAWGLGRVDVTPDGIDNPVAITDLRPVRFQTNLHHAATLKNDPVALAVRIETLIITSNDEAVRPPRPIAAALAVYLLSLGTHAPRDTSSEGARVFERTCAGCHRGDGATGPAVPLDVVGTDPTVGQSPDRGTGTYRVPSLRDVGDRRRLFASGAVDDIDALLDPSRRVAGHRFGLDLSAANRAALLAYLRTL